MSTVSFQDYIKIISGNVIRPVCKLELLHDNDESVYDTLIQRVNLSSSNTLTISNSQGCRRSISISLTNADNKLKFNNNDGQLYINTKFNFYIGVMDEHGNSIFFPQGVFCLARSQPEWVSSNSGERVVNLQANDKWSLLDNNIDGIYQIESGESLTERIKEILKICNDPMTPIISSSIPDKAEYTMRWDGSSTYATIIKEIANMHSRDVFYDINGSLRYQEFLNPNTCASIWDYTPNSFQYMGSNRIMQNDKVYNQVRVTSSNSDGAIYTGFAQNTDLTSPNNIYNIPKHTLYISDDKIYSQVMAQTRADVELNRVKNLQETISLKSVVLPHFTCNEAITLTDPALNLNRARYFIQSISMPLDMKSEMTVTAYKYSTDRDFQDFSDLPPSLSN